MDAGTLNRDNILGRAGVDTGTAQDTEILVDRNIRLDTVTFQIHCRNGRRQINSTARADVNTRGTAAGAFVGIEDDLAFKELVNRNRICWTNLFAPGTRNAEIRVYANGTGELFLIRYGYAADGDCIMRTCIGTDTAGITKCTVPDNLSGRLWITGIERNAFDTKCRTK